MRIPILGLIVIFIFLTTYKNNNFFSYEKFNIKNIIIEENHIISTDELKKDLDFLYFSNLFFLDVKRLESALLKKTFIKSFRIKKIYPDKIKIIISEKKPVAILLNSKKKFYITKNGDLINFTQINSFKDLPTIIGNGDKFSGLYKSLEHLNFPIDKIKSYYFFEVGRWDLILLDGRTIKLPVSNYILSLKKFMELKNTTNFKKFKIFDYRIKDQLILNWMEKNLPKLFIEINNFNLTIVAGKFDENDNFKLLEKIIFPHEVVKQNKFTNVDNISSTIKKNVEVIEGKINYMFKDVILILDSFNQTSINVSGYKKLNGSQVLKENISYILNSLKLAIMESEKEKTILHIFNSKSILDGVINENLPIGLFGNFYTHELTFFLIENNDLKNLKKIFEKISLNIEKILLKSFSEGTQLINQNKNNQNFFKVTINQDFSELFFFSGASFKFIEKFNFGTNIIFKDIEKICSIDINLIKKFLGDNFETKKEINENDLLEKKYFNDEKFRKIRKKLIYDIISARVEEITDIILTKNINLHNFKNDSYRVFVTLTESIFDKDFEFYFSKNKIKLEYIKKFDIESSISNIANLSLYGWRKEAIPVTQSKSSLVTRIFNYLFD